MLSENGAISSLELSMMCIWLLCNCVWAKLQYKELSTCKTFWFLMGIFLCAVMQLFYSSVGFSSWKVICILTAMECECFFWCHSWDSQLVHWPSFWQEKGLGAFYSHSSILLSCWSALITHRSVPVSFKPLVGEFCIVTCISLFVVETMLTRFTRVVRMAKVRRSCRYIKHLL